MTILDLIAIAAASMAVVQIYGYRRRAMDIGTLVTLFGLLIWTFFFLADLAAMHLGHLVTDQPPSTLMNKLHANFYWFGGLGGVLMVAIGVTISHRRHQTASSPLENFVELIDHLPDPCMIISNDKIVAVNDALNQLIHSDAHDLVDHDPREVWDTMEFNIPSRKQISDALMAYGTWSFVTKLIRPDGSTGHAEVRVSLLDAKEGQVLVFLEDITARVEAERRLRESEMRLATAQEIADLGYWHYHQRENSTEWSPAMTRIFGIDTPEYQQAYPTDDSRWALIHPDDRELVRSCLTSAIESGIEPPDISIRIIKPDEEVRHLRTRFGLARDGEGHVEEVFAVIQDITDAVRTEERLRHAQKMETVGSLTGGVSHDFNNLLQVILGNTELLDTMSIVDDEAAESIRAIKRAAERGSELTRLLLAFSRRQILEPKTVNINDYTQQILPLLTRSLGETITIKPILAEDLAYCRIDPGQLENCILNMAINAQHAMPEGGTLAIETRNTTLSEEYAAMHEEVTAGDYVQLTIRDTGVGMPKEIRERVFEPFFTTKEVGKGSGLGLSMVYGFIKQSGGHVEIASEPGVGTAITLYLPMTDKAEDTQQATIIKEDDQRFSGTVLLVEDDQQVALLTRRFLESLGFDVVVANNVDQVRETLSTRNHFVLLLTDVVLPGGTNGPAIAEVVKSRHPHIKVLYMSGYTENAIHAHDDAVLLDKPFRKADLVEKITQIL